jgi:AcrR family transcriptional regulator
MSSEITGAGRGAGRPYRKRRRAEQEQLTRLRIAEAAVELHGSVGPAATTVSAIAERAGVQRATVYRHFPEQESLFAACSSLWRERNPSPDLDAWRAIDDPGERLRHALDDLYGWYERCEAMLERVFRDAPRVPAMRVPASQTVTWFQQALAVLDQGRRERGARRRRVRAATGHAVAFETWRSLVRRQSLARADAVELMAGLVEWAARASERR